VGRMAYLVWGSLSLIAGVAAAIEKATGAADTTVVETLLVAVLLALWTLQPRRRD